MKRRAALYMLIKFVDENNGCIEINTDKVKMKISEIISKCKRREDWINFSRELGKYFINIFRIILS